MDKILLKIRVMRDHELFNDYTLGRISGFKQCICDGMEETSGGYANVQYEGHWLLRCEATKDKCEKLIRIINLHYPGMCEFYM